MSHHVYDMYYIDVPTENIFESFVDNTSTPVTLTNSTYSQQFNDQSDTNTPIDLTPLIPSLNNPWRPDEVFRPR
ncbi:2310_t:CDS:2 [Funneliformis caledonium]|uniref:2310_t:CDS:1 n=1 Tax=Funneliformis caledonium TaxID=1117310 RepID=A0A9N9B3Z2_9GLOM|nr:2310_t:CDS:2 [Funneliformis caledonium]